MIFENCRRLLKASVDAGLIQTVPPNAKSIQEDGSIIDLPEGYLIFSEQGKDEGGFVQSLEEAAQDLMYDRAGQRFLKIKLAEVGISPKLIDEKDWFAISGWYY